MLYNDNMVYKWAKEIEEVYGQLKDFSIMDTQIYAIAKKLNKLKDIDPEIKVHCDRITFIPSTQGFSLGPGVHTLYFPKKINTDFVCLDVKFPKDQYWQCSSNFEKYLIIKEVMEDYYKIEIIDKILYIRIRKIENGNVTEVLDYEKELQKFLSILPVDTLYTNIYLQTAIDTIESYCKKLNKQKGL